MAVPPFSTKQSFSLGLCAINCNTSESLSTFSKLSRKKFVCTANCAISFLLYEFIAVLFIKG